MKRHLSDSEPENCDDYDECSSPDTMQISRKKRRGIIEKRRRDRINNCLVELRRLVPAAFEKQGSAKLEKAEILQMTVDHLRHLQSRDPRGFNDPYSPYGNTRAFLDYGIMGFRECATEIAHFLSNLEGVDVKEPLKLRMMGHLENMVAQKELAINAAMAANSQVGVAAAAAAAASTKLPAPATGPQPAAALQTVVSLPSVSIPYAPLTPPRASPDNLSPPASFPVAEPLPRFSVAFPMPTTPIISLAPTNGTMPAVFHPAPSGFKPVFSAAAVVQQQQPSAPTSVVKPAPTLAPLPCPPAARPLTVITSAAMTSGATDSTFGPLTPPLDKNMTAGRPESTISAPSPTKTPTNSTKAPFRPWADSIDVTNNA